MIVLDTHVLIWWINGDSELSRSALKAIEAEQSGGGEILVSAISAWEIAMLVERGRLTISREIGEWMDLIKSIPAVRFVSIDDEIAMQSVALPGDLHKDPADRFIVATARKFGAALATKDEKLTNYEFVETIW
jgi:PIN domain nuclease of toxin-antitoxin system